MEERKKVFKVKRNRGGEEDLKGISLGFWKQKKIFKEISMGVNSSHALPSSKKLPRQHFGKITRMPLYIMYSYTTLPKDHFTHELTQV